MLSDASPNGCNASVSSLAKCAYLARFLHLTACQVCADLLACNTPLLHVFGPCKTVLISVSTVVIIVADGLGLEIMSLRFCCDYHV